MSEATRLDKHLVKLIECSRGDAQKYIEGGWVLVDGEIIDQPQFMITDQQVELHADANLTPLALMTILLHLPEGVDVTDTAAQLKLITPATRAPNDESDIRTLKRHFARLHPTAPLEVGASGLVVFSQDGRVVNRLVNDASKNEQEYLVEVSGEIEPDGLDRLNSKMKRDNWILPATKASWQNETHLRLAMKNVRAGQIEFMCNSVGLTVVSMKRLRIGSVPMGKIQPGQWRYLPVGVLF